MSITNYQVSAKEQFFRHRPDRLRPIEFFEQCLINAFGMYSKRLFESTVLVTVTSAQTASLSLSTTETITLSITATIVIDVIHTTTIGVTAFETVTDTQTDIDHETTTDLVDATATESQDATVTTTENVIATKVESVTFTDTVFTTMIETIYTDITSTISVTQVNTDPATTTTTIFRRSAPALESPTLTKGYLAVTETITVATNTITNTAVETEFSATGTASAFTTDATLTSTQTQTVIVTSLATETVITSIATAIVSVTVDITTELSTTSTETQTITASTDTTTVPTETDTITSTTSTESVTTIIATIDSTVITTATFTSQTSLPTCTVANQQQFHLKWGDFAWEYPSSSFSISDASLYTLQGTALSDNAGNVLNERTSLLGNIGWSFALFRTMAVTILTAYTCSITSGNLECHFGTIVDAQMCDSNGPALTYAMPGWSMDSSCTIVLDLSKALRQFYGDLTFGSANMDDERGAHGSTIVELGDTCSGETGKTIVDFDLAAR
ncbi:hypothetical protein SCUP234_11308 [Seiridium cupressi]